MAEPNSARSTTAGRTGPGSTTPGSFGETNQTGEQHENWLLGRVRDSATAGIESQKQRATDGLGNIAQVVRGTTEQLRNQHHESLAEYVEQAANQIDRFSQQLKNKEVREIYDDAQRLARKNPAAFAGTAFALGLVTARFLKSSHDTDGEYDGRYWEQERWGGAGARDQYGATGLERGASTASPQYSTQYTPPHGDAALGTTPGSATDSARRTSGASTGGTAKAGMSGSTGTTGTASRTGGSTGPEGTSSRPATNRPGGETERS